MTKFAKSIKDGKKVKVEQMTSTTEQYENKSGYLDADSKYCMVVSLH